MAANETFGWLWILTGLLAGLVLGLNFHREDWLGGYGSFRRRLLRLGHVSFVALGFLNILFALSAARVRLAPASLEATSIALITGGVAMPLCCAIVAWRPGFRHLFAVPIIALVSGAALVAWGFVGP